MSDKQQAKPLTASEYMAAFVLAFLAAFLWRQSLDFALFMSVLAVVALAFLMAESLAGARTAVWSGIVAVWDMVMTWLRWERKVKLRYGELPLGLNVYTRRWVHRHIEQLQSMLIAGVTGGGKSVQVHSMVYYIIKYYLDPSFIQLAFIDLKVQAIDFAIYRRLNLLFRPVAMNVNEADQLLLHVLDEMERRGQLYRLVSGGDGDYLRACPNIGRYHELKRKLYLTDLPNLPYLLVFIDEISEFTRNSKYLNRLKKIAESGRAFGIYLVACTQYPVNDSIPSILRQEMPTRFIFQMAPSGFRTIDVLNDVKPDHKLNTHECYAALGNSGVSYITLRTSVIPFEEQEKMVNARSGNQDFSWRNFDTLDGEDFDVDEDDLREDWNGKSDDQKRASLWTWFNSFHERPSVDEFLAKYNTSERTYYNWVRPSWKERFGDYDAVNPNAVPNEA